MKKKKDDIKNRFIVPEKCYGIFSAILTMLILLIALMARQMLGGECIFIKGDLFEQCAPFAHLFVDKLFSGSNLYYSFKAGMGMNTSLLFAFSVFSPFNILYLFSNGANVNTIAITVFVLKAGLAAFSFQTFAQYNLKTNNVISVIFSIGYALASYGICVVDMTPLYDGVYLLPLILVAIKYLIDNKKSAWLVVLYTILFVSNFYSGYIVGIASFGYFCMYLVFFYKSDEKRIVTILRYFMGVICAFLISAFIIGPALYEALSQRVIDSEYSFEMVKLWNIISSLFPFHKFRMYSTVPYCYCGMPALLSIVAFFTNKEIKRKYKIVCMVALLMVVLPMGFEILYSAAHMFNDPTGFTYRYVYIISMIVCSMGVVTLKKIKGIRITITIIINTILILVHLASSVINTKMGYYYNPLDSIYYVVTVILGIMWLLLLVLHFRDGEIKAGKKFLSIREIAILALFLIGVEVGLNAYVLLEPRHYQNIDEYEYRMKQAEVLTEEVAQYDDSIYRVHYDGLMNLNQSCLYDYYGTTLYSSSENRRLKDFLYGIGVSCTKFSIYENGTTDLSKLLFDEKYNLVAHIFYSDNNENYITENRVVGMGFMVSDSAIELPFGPNVFENQNAVFSALSGNEYKPYEIYEDDIVVESSNVYTGVSDDGAIVFGLADGVDSGYISIQAPLKDGYEMYSWISSDDNYVLDTSPVLQSVDVYEECDYLEHLLTAPHILRMSNVADLNEIEIWLNSNTEDVGYVSDCNLAYYDSAYIEPLVDRLSEQVFNVKTFKDGYVTGDINVRESGICFISIPYENGWTAIVDGSPQKITPVFNEAFIGISLDAGYHEIELRFEAPGSKLGIILSCLGIIMLFGMMTIECKVFSKNK